MGNNKMDKKKLDLNSLPKSYDSWNVGSRYEIIKEIGIGSYGSVVQALDKTTNEKVAIKKVDKVFDDLIDGKRILREIALLRHLRHPTIVNIIEILPPKDPKRFNEVFLVMEYAQSDLKKLFKSPYHLEMSHINTLAYGILVGLKYIHTAGVLHRDLKPANVLINQDCTVKICDFGLARSVEGLNEAEDKKKAAAKEEADDILAGLPKSKKLSKKIKEGQAQRDQDVEGPHIARSYQVVQGP